MPTLTEVLNNTKMKLPFTTGVNEYSLSINKINYLTDLFINQSEDIDQYRPLVDKIKRIIDDEYFKDPVWLAGFLAHYLDDNIIDWLMKQRIPRYIEVELCLKNNSLINHTPELAELLILIDTAS